MGGLYLLTECTEPWEKIRTVDLLVDLVLENRRVAVVQSHGPPENKSRRLKKVKANTNSMNFRLFKALNQWIYQPTTGT